ncbi:MAG: helix-turn-helix transcriptional regulator [Clostridia bacterium]|nr:helix-turn-helix transcriptional regulator [Clostridia bacterium]
MSLSLLDPYIRYFFITDKYFCSSVYMYADDYRLFLGVKDGCVLVTEDKNIPLTENTAVIIPPKTFYRLEKQAPSEILIMNFDMDKSHADTDPLSPIPASAYKKESEFSVILPKPYDRLVVFNNEAIAKKLFDIYNEYTHQTAYYQELVSAEFKVLLIRIAGMCNTEAPYPKYLDDILKYLDKNFQSNPSNNDIAKLFGFNPNYLSNVFKECTGYSLHTYILNKKAVYAKQLLAATDMPIQLISEEAGFSNQNRFTEFFKNRFGISPSEFRKSSMLFKK